MVVVLRVVAGGVVFRRPGGVWSWLTGRLAHQSWVSRTRQLDHWTRCGYLRPVQRENGHGSGTGYAREWPEYELTIAACMGRLVAAGLRPDVAARLARLGWRADAVLFLLTE